MFGRNSRNNAATKSGGLWDKLGSCVKGALKLGAIYLAGKTIKNVVLDQFAQKQHVSDVIKTSPGEQTSAYVNSQMSAYENMNAAASPSAPQREQIDVPVVNDIVDDGFSLA